MRITFGQLFEDGMRDINRINEEMADAQRRVSSGRRINSPTDDPMGTAQAIREHASMSTIDAYERTADAATSRLAVMDSALSDVINQLTAAKVNATAARGSGRTAAQLAAYSADIIGIRDALTSDINTRFGSTYLFAGSAGSTPPYASLSGGGVSAYQGDSSQQSVDISNGRSVQVSFDGSQILQGSDPTHIVDALTALATAITAGDATGIQAGVDAIDRAFARATSAQTRVGISQRMLADTRPQLDTAHIGAQTRASKIEDADMAAALSDLSRAETAQRAVLGTFGTAGRLSLLDFLK